MMCLSKQASHIPSSLRSTGPDEALEAQSSSTGEEERVGEGVGAGEGVDLLSTSRGTLPARRKVSASLSSIPRGGKKREWVGG